MREFLIYALFLFLAPFIAGFWNVILMVLGAGIVDIFKIRKHKKLFNIFLFIESLCATFLTVFLIRIVLEVLSLHINWIFITILIVFFVINGLRRIEKSDNQDRSFEIYEVLADVVGILLAFFLLGIS